MNAIPANTGLDRLAELWRESKQAEDSAGDRRLDIERRILALVDDELPDKGTTKIAGLKIVTGFSETWNQDRLRTIQQSWNMITHDNPMPFPFEVELKPTTNVKWIKDNRLDLWEKIQEALTVKPKKPGFSEGK